MASTSSTSMPMAISKSRSSSTSSTASSTDSLYDLYPRRSPGTAATSAACAFPSWPLGRSLASCPTASSSASATSYISDEDLLEEYIPAVSHHAVDEADDCIAPHYHRDPAIRHNLRRNGPAVLNLDQLVSKPAAKPKSKKTTVSPRRKREGKLTVVFESPE